MNTLLSRAISAGLFFLLIFLSGFWLSRSGKPYSAILFNVHKLIALGTVIFLAITVAKMRQTSPLEPLQFTAIAAAGLFFAATIVTGGLLNIDRPLPAAIAIGHRLLPYLTTLSTAITLYLLMLIRK